MNRRNFFKTVTGFIVGVFTTSAIAKEKPKLTVAMLQKAKNDLDAQRECNLRDYSTEFGESRNFIYQGYYFTVRDVYDSELKYMTLHPFFEIQGILSMFMLNYQFDDLQIRNRFLDEMIRQWKEKQVYTTEELRGF